MTINEIKNKMDKIDLEYNRNTAMLHGGKITWNEWDTNATNLYNEFRELELELKELSK